MTLRSVPDLLPPRAAPSREYAAKVVEFWREHHYGIAWTVGNTGDDAKMVRESWPNTAQAVNGDLDAAIEDFLQRGGT